ncbi:unnamed protein product [Symbiodinium pilosum]|uniref:Uncharacterized protein n=1 Tax=Symbiodinium pilosum TaxID=2952 RepID=A0A812K5C2_SYMPI|nr:unnamed protein product [Symbiodinium pilosum]
MTKPDAIAARLAPVWGWEVSPQEDAAFGDEFAVSMKKAAPKQITIGASQAWHEHSAARPRAEGPHVASPFSVIPFSFPLFPLYNPNMYPVVTLVPI